MAMNNVVICDITILTRINWGVSNWIHVPNTDHLK